MSSMDGLRSQLAEVQGVLRDVVGRLNALEEKVAQQNSALSQGTSPMSVPLTDTKPQNINAKPSTSAVTRK